MIGQGIALIGVFIVVVSFNTLCDFVDTRSGYFILGWCGAIVSLVVYTAIMNYYGKIHRQWRLRNKLRKDYGGI